MKWLRVHVFVAIVKFIELNLPHYVINKKAKEYCMENLARWIHRIKM